MPRVAYSSELEAQVNEMIRLRLVHEVHTSERRSFRGCRRRWSWLFQDFYYPRTTAKPLEFGVAFHNGMEVLYDPETWQLNREVVLNAAKERFAATCRDQKKKFLEETARLDLDADAEEDYDDRIELGVGMLDYYAKHVAPEYDKGYTPLRTEVEFIVPIQDDNQDYLFCKCVRCQITQKNYWQDNIKEYYALCKEWGIPAFHAIDWDSILPHWPGLPVVLAGRIDLLVEDRYGYYWIVDWKTTARLARGDVSGQDRDEFLELDDQIGSYVMALRRKLGLKVRGFIYVELKKSLIEPPQRNSVQRLGRWFSVNKQQAVDYETYKRTVETEDPEAFKAGLYDDHLEWLKEGGQNYHNRYQIVKTDAELEEIERNLFAEASEMTDPDLRIYPSAGRFACGFCAFRQPCLEKNRQQDYQYMLDTLFDRRKQHYWVKTELSTDSQGGE